MSAYFQELVRFKSITVHRKYNATSNSVVMAALKLRNIN